MNIEIERKFLVTSDAWRREVTQTFLLRQGYLCVEPGCTVRVRISGDAAWLTVKGKRQDGAAPEFEYPIPVTDAAVLLERLAKKPLIEKKRHLVPHQGLVWEVDEFFGDNAGLLLAELELPSAGRPFRLPDWAGAEVTDDARYANSNLVARPFKTWQRGTEAE